jgi:type VI secretion system lysozyme-like protein
MESRNQYSNISPRTNLAAGLAVPLFDRFDEEKDDSRVAEPYRVHGLSLLLESIQKEIENLLNTRLPPSRSATGAWEPISEPQTVLDYGLPAFSTLSAGSPTDIGLLGKVVVGKIAAFEPRLQDPMLELVADQNDPAGMLGTLRGTVRVDKGLQTVSFPVTLRNHGESAALSEGAAE